MSYRYKVCNFAQSEWIKGSGMDKCWNWPNWVRTQIILWQYSSDQITFFASLLSSLRIISGHTRKNWKRETALLSISLTLCQCHILDYCLLQKLNISYYNIIFQLLNHQHRPNDWHNQTNYLIIVLSQDQTPTQTYI